MPTEELPFLLSGASCFAWPSLWEGFGIPVLEAMACGIPTVVSKVGTQSDAMLALYKLLKRTQRQATAMQPAAKKSIGPNRSSYTAVETGHVIIFKYT